MPKTTVPLISIVSIALNNLKGLQKTYKSIENQTFKGFEWVVIDGVSDDGTREWLTKTPEIGLDSCWISEKDQGIYDAMNKGIDQAEGQYILFLNAGDELAGPNVLQTLSQKIKSSNNPDFVYGDAYEEGQNGQKLYKKARHASKIASGMITHHQAMLYRRSVIGKDRYDLSYQLAADYDFTARFLKRAKTDLYCDKALCVFEAGGISQKNAKTARGEEFQIRQVLELCSAPMNLLTTMRQTLAAALKSTAPAVYYKLR